MKITGIQAAEQAEKSVERVPPIQYDDEDCQGFVEQTIIRAGGEIPNYAGSNDMYRNACSEIIPLPIARLQSGMVLFIVSHDGKEPDKYKPDGKGNASHIGWYTGIRYEVVHSASSVGHVAPSTLRNGWTHAGYLKAIQYNGNADPIPSPISEHGTGYINLPADSNVFHRIKPSKSSGYWGRISGGTEVETAGTSKGWTRVIYGGHDGYIISDLITQIAPAEHTIPPTIDPATELKETFIRELNALKGQIDAILGTLGNSIILSERRDDL